MVFTPMSETFKLGRNNVEDGLRSKNYVTSDETIASVEQVMLDDRRLKKEEIVKITNL